jgi:heat shock protein HslJ
MAAAGFSAALVALACAACTSVAVDARTFAGTRWHVAAINGHPTPTSDDRFHMEFTGAGFTGRFGCNSAQGSYRIAGNRFQPGMTVFTQAACYVDAPAAIQPMTYEKWAFEVVRRPMRIRWINGRTLTLSNAAGSIALERIR